MDLKIIKINGFNKIILGEPGFIPALELLNIGLQPYGLGKIKGHAYLGHCMKNLFRPGSTGIVLTDYNIL